MLFNDNTMFNNYRAEKYISNTSIGETSRRLGVEAVRTEWWVWIPSG